MNDEVKKEFPPRKPPLQEFMDSIEWMLDEGAKSKIKLTEKYEQQMAQLDMSIADNIELLKQLKELMALKNEQTS